jgi:hypothetical protein
MLAFLSPHTLQLGSFENLRKSVYTRCARNQKRQIEEGFSFNSHCQVVVVKYLRGRVPYEIGDPIGKLFLFEVFIGLLA